MAQARVCDALSERRLVAVAWRARYAAGGGGGGFGGLGGGGLGGLGGNMGATHFRLWRGGVRPDHPTPRGRRPVPRGDLHDATNHDAVGEHVEVVVAPLAGWARSQGALEDQGIGHGRGRPHGGPLKRYKYPGSSGANAVGLIGAVFAAKIAGKNRRTLSHGLRGRMP